MDKVTVLNEKVTVLGTKLPFLKSSFFPKVTVSGLESLDIKTRFWTKVTVFLGKLTSPLVKVNESLGES